MLDVLELFLERSRAASVLVDLTLLELGSALGLRHERRLLICRMLAGSVALVHSSSPSRCPS